MASSRVGAEFQAVVPDLEPRDEGASRKLDEQCQPVWLPSRSGRARNLERFVKFMHTLLDQDVGPPTFDLKEDPDEDSRQNQLRLPRFSEEQALRFLHQCDYDVNLAIETLTPWQEEDPDAAEDAARAQDETYIEGDDFCLACREGGDLLICEYPGCKKVFHPGCANLERIPEGAWHCPYHECVSCKGKVEDKSFYCSRCPTAYCQKKCMPRDLKGKSSRLGLVEFQCAACVQVIMEKNTPDFARRDFVHRVLHMLARQGTPVLQTPAIGSKELDIAIFYREVTRRGGVYKVVANSLWADVKRSMKLPAVANLPFVLKKHYMNILYPYEKKFFAASEPVPLSMIQDLPDKAMLMNTCLRAAAKAAERERLANGGVSSEPAAAPAPDAKKGKSSSSSSSRRRVAGGSSRSKPKKPSRPTIATNNKPQLSAAAALAAAKKAAKSREDRYKERAAQRSSLLADLKPKKSSSDDDDDDDDDDNDDGEEEEKEGDDKEKGGEDKSGDAQDADAKDAGASKPEKEQVKKEVVKMEDDDSSGSKAEAGGADKAKSAPKEDATAAESVEGDKAEPASPSADGDKKAGSAVAEASATEGGSSNGGSMKPENKAEQQQAKAQDKEPKAEEGQASESAAMAVDEEGEEEQEDSANQSKSNGSGSSQDDGLAPMDVAGQGGKDVAAIANGSDEAKPAAATATAAAGSAAAAPAKIVGAQAASSNIGNGSVKRPRDAGVVSAAGEEGLGQSSPKREKL